MCFEMLSLGSKILDMTSEGFGEMLDGDFADMFGETFPLMSMGDKQTPFMVGQGGVV
jgi:hypothetical protein